MDAVRYGNSFPKDLVLRCFEHMPLSRIQKRRATDLQGYVLAPLPLTKYEDMFHGGQLERGKGLSPLLLSA